ncbi:MAG: hypothetical protein EXX96DRAFT_648518 [Benjaminiella poitrasii]|nr:MAG: hypothetical protein EXX96DRAFT_648518 [Benjaminiella poitrasii]
MITSYKVKRDNDKKVRFSSPTIDVICVSSGTVSSPSSSHSSAYSELLDPSFIDTSPNSPRPQPTRNRDTKRKLTRFIPTRRTIMKQFRILLVLHGLERDALYRRLVYEDSKLDPTITHLRWNYGFRFSAYFLWKGNRKVGNSQIFIDNNGRQSKNARCMRTDRFPGLDRYLSSKGIDHEVLDSSLGQRVLDHFDNHKEHQRQISSFLYAFCAFLYSFLPNYKQKYKIKFDPDQFKLATSTAAAAADDNVLALDYPTSSGEEDIKIEPEDEVHMKRRLVTAPI